MDAMSLRQRMENKLREAFSPDRLNVIDESHMHAGHQPDMTGTGETHMRVQIVSEQFSGKSRVDRHRAINGLLKPELDAGLHALAIEAAAPGEPTRF
jgi:BolA protein